MELKIHNNTYNLYFVDEHDDRLLMPDNEYHTGVTNFTKKEIYIRNNLNVDSYRYTVVHELTHAIIDSYGLLQVDWNDEIVADFIANYYYDIIEILTKIEDMNRR